MIYLIVIMLMGGDAGTYKQLPGMYTTIAECETVRASVIQEAVKETRFETLVSACMAGPDTIVYKSYGGLAAKSKKEGV